MIQHRVEFHWILLILVMMVSTTEVKKQETSYIGQGVRGNKGAEFMAESPQECSLR